MSDHRPKRDKEDDAPDPLEQKRAIADAADEEDGEPQLARDRMPKPEDAEKASGGGDE